MIGKRISEFTSRLPLSKWQIKLLFLLFGMSILISVILYTQILVNELIIREKKIVTLYADMYRSTLEGDTNPMEMAFLFDKITPSITFPIIITDDKDNPLKPFIQNSLNVTIDSTKSDIEQESQIRKLINKMGHTYPPILVADKQGKVIQKFYYTNSALISKLQFFPMIEIFIVSIFVLIGYMAFSNIRRNEESKVWVGMAKEAAHQLGTPLSSLLAWLEIIKYNKDNPSAVVETALEMENDIARLNTIATRFSKIGSLPEKKIESLAEVIEKVCIYFEKRLPHLGRKVQIVRNLKVDFLFEINSELFQWVIENLLKNAAESIESKQGAVTIKLYQHKKNIIITVSDSGKGMSARLKRQVFNPGFTTKKRGWGLGLSLSKRIIEQYHGGKIYVKDSTPGKGTTFAIELPLISNSTHLSKS
jgi:hypothetical protein